MKSEATLAPQSEVDKFEAALDRARTAIPEAPPEEQYVDGRKVTWVPQAGSQELFMACPLMEALYHGTRGPGKTDALLMSYLQYVDCGYGSAWRGIIFRETYPQLADVVAKSERWFRQIFPGAKFNRQRMAWEFPAGEVLFFRHMKRREDYWNYHGHEYPFIGWEELTNWPDDGCYKSMFSCCRSSSLPAEAPRMIRATTNPYGVGHNWVKERWRLHGDWWTTIIISDSLNEKGDPEPPRVAIHGHINENKILLAKDPNYKANIGAAADNEAMAAAWEDGSWDLVAGGMFSDVWDSRRNQMPRFEVPHTWKIDRAFDWGSSAPFSVGWWAESDGSDLVMPDGRAYSTVRGDLFRVKEWYGWNGRANQGLRMLATEIAEGIVEREIKWGWRTERDCRVRNGVADSAIFKVENGNCIATDFEQPVRLDGRLYHGIHWLRSDKSAGSRKNGWELMRAMIRGAQSKPGLPRETKGLFVVAEECNQWIRTVLTLPRDEKDMDDVDTNAEDHQADESRYRVRHVGQSIRSGTTTGGF